MGILSGIIWPDFKLFKIKNWPQFSKFLNLVLVQVLKISGAFQTGPPNFSNFHISPNVWIFKNFKFSFLPFF